MGGEAFRDTVTGKTAQAAFDATREQALYDFGHAGYTGTIGEKTEFVVCECPEGMAVGVFVRLIESYKPDLAMLSGDQAEAVKTAMKVFNDKWGPAVCVPHPDDPEKFTFCGVASS